MGKRDGEIVISFDEHEYRYFHAMTLSIFMAPAQNYNQLINIDLFEVLRHFHG